MDVQKAVGTGVMTGAKMEVQWVDWRGVQTEAKWAHSKVDYHSTAQHSTAQTTSNTDTGKQKMTAQRNQSQMSVCSLSR